MNTKTKYPLGQTAPETISTRTGKPLSEVTLEQVRRGEVVNADLAIHPDTLRAQANVAEEHGYPQLASNLRRAAELALLPQERILAIYEALRPYRTTYEQLAALAEELEQTWQAPENARLMREAAEAYRQHTLV
ncbi:MAG: diol dehydratase small subunit [Anaerolineae bacterium]